MISDIGVSEMEKCFYERKKEAVGRTASTGEMLRGAMICALTLVDKDVCRMQSVEEDKDCTVSGDLEHNHQKSFIEVKI